MPTAQVRRQEFAADGANLSPGGQASGTAEPGALAVHGRGGQTWTAGGKALLPPGYGPATAVDGDDIVSADDAA
jgi:hypothetical protein